MGSSEFLKGENFLPARDIIGTVKIFLETLDVNIYEYQTRAQETVKNFQIDHQFYLNKAQNLICCRILDYIFILMELQK